jgi:hypothetical protein
MYSYAKNLKVMKYQILNLYALFCIFSGEISAQYYNTCPTNDIYIALDNATRISIAELPQTELDTTVKKVNIYIPIGSSEADTFNLNLCQLKQFNNLEQLNFFTCTSDHIAELNIGRYGSDIVSCLFYGFPTFGKNVKQMTFGNLGYGEQNQKIITALNQMAEPLSKIECRSDDLAHLLLENQIKVDTLVMPLGSAEVAIKNTNLKTLILFDSYTGSFTHIANNQDIEFEDFATMLKSLNNQSLYILGNKRTKKWLKRFNLYAPNLKSLYHFQQMSEKKYIVYCNQSYNR